MTINQRRHVAQVEALSFAGDVFKVSRSNSTVNLADNAKAVRVRLPPEVFLAIFVCGALTIHAREANCPACFTVSTESAHIRVESDDARWCGRYTEPQSEISSADGLTIELFASTA